MSILIKNMEMPTDDSIRIILYPDGRVVKSNAVEYEEFEAIPVPPHGRLIDADELKEWIANWFTMNRQYHPYAKDNNIPITELYDILDRIPTIIEAEEDET